MPEMSDATRAALREAAKAAFEEGDYIEGVQRVTEDAWNEALDDLRAAASEPS